LLDSLTKYVKEISFLYRDFVKKDESWQEKEKFAERAKEIEHQADDVTHTIIDQLNRTFITPLDREDIYLLAHELDDIVDKIENVIHNIIIYKISEKEKFLVEFSEIYEKAGEDLVVLMTSLAKQKYTEEVKKLIIHIHDLEDNGDCIFINSVSDLFNNGTDALHIIKWKDVLEDLERIADKFQSVSNTIEGIIVKFG